MSQQIDAEMPEFIATMRKRLRLSQRQANVFFGVTENAFSGFETGETKPPLPLILLFQLLDKQPALFGELESDLIDFVPS